MPALPTKTTAFLLRPESLVRCRRLILTTTPGSGPSPLPSMAKDAPWGSFEQSAVGVAQMVFLAYNDLPPRSWQIQSLFARMKTLHRPENVREGSSVPRFSIVVPAYNAVSTLAETLDAILAQTFTDWGCVIVDDGSLDSTGAMALKYVHRDPRFRLVTQANQGTAGAYNTGVQATSADTVVMCSADDILLPNHLSVMDDFIHKNPDYGIYSSNGAYLFSSGDKTQVYTLDEWQRERSLSIEEVLACCFFSVGAAYRRKVFDLVGGYRKDVYGEDYDFWLRAMAIGVTHYYTPHVLSLHRVSDYQKSSDILRVYASNIEVYKNLIDSEWVHSDQVKLVESAIVSRQKLIRNIRRNQAIQRRADSVSLMLNRVLGRRVAERTTRAAFAFCRKLRAWKHPR